MNSKSPFKDRMRALSARLPPPPSHSEHELIMAALTRRAETDLAFRLKMGDLREQVPPFVMTRMHGGSGFPIAQTLRTYFLEYFDRLIKLGPYSLPTSFNVIESFLSFSERFVAFDLREEREQLLRLHEYIDWYTAGSFPDKPAILTDILPEGIVYSYNMVSPLDDFAIETIDSKLRIVGVAMVRHGPELSAMILAGESPPFPSDEGYINELTKTFSEQAPPRGKEGLRPDSSYGVKDRYIPELPGHARVVLLARFNLDHSHYDVRYVNLDIGASYLVLTDDRTIYDSEPRPDDVAQLTERLERYSGLFSFVASMLYIPAFFLDQASRIIETRFATGLQLAGATAKTNAIKVLGLTQVPFFRTVRCLVGIPPDTHESIRTVEPPDMAFHSSGYWRPLVPGEIGEAKDGTPIVGKTWVQRTDSWSARSLSSFVVSRSHRVIAGNDPGWVYIMRSGSHYADLYKIGSTRRSSETRAAELTSATGVPTSFEVLAQWEVGDCSKLEDEIHKRLKFLRVNKKREFFRGNLQVIIAAIDEVLRKSNADV